MTVQIIVLISVIALFGILSVVWCVCVAVSEKSIGAGIAAAFMLIVTAVFCVSIGWWQLNTESGKRALKTQQSNLHGGITRRVTVYDMEGDTIAAYEGKFDVEHKNNENRIMFDDENGKRHIIYYTTGTITVDEISK